MGRSDEFLTRHPGLLDEDRASPRAARLLAALTWPFQVYFRFKIKGLESIPAGPSLLVANHSAGAVPEILLLHRAWRRVHGDRPVGGLAHQIAWQLPLRLLPIAQLLGGVFAHPTVAARALARGRSLLVFPGGDRDVMRPFSRRYEVGFFGRHGFVRLARRARVPIVPVAICGSHAAFLIPPGAPRLARLTGMRRLFGLDVLPMTVGLLAALGLGAAALAHPPLWPLASAALLQALWPAPTRIEAEVLPPIGVDPADSDDAVAERVRAAMQAAMDRMAAHRWTPWG